MAYRDIFGKALMAHYLDSARNEYLVERDDGLSEPLPTDNYFMDSSRFSDGLKAALEHVSGRVLDIGCGAGRVSLHRILSDDGIIIAQSRDPYDTDREVHLRYHQRNIENGRPAGQVTIRVGFNGEYSDWFDLLMQSREEMAETIHPYWQIDRTYDNNIAILRKH